MVCIGAKKLKYIEAYCPGGSQFLRNCTLLQRLPVQGFILKILSRGYSHKGGNNKKGVTVE